jgi:chemotaxis signal transduction protein
MIATGLIVHAVEDVPNFTAKDISPPPNFGGVLATDFILGVANAKGRVTTLLNVDARVSALQR